MGSSPTDSTAKLSRSFFKDSFSLLLLILFYLDMFDVVLSLRYRRNHLIGTQRLTRFLSLIVRDVEDQILYVFKGFENLNILLESKLLKKDRDIPSVNFWVWQAENKNTYILGTLLHQFLHLILLLYAFAELIYSVFYHLLICLFIVSLRFMDFVHLLLQIIVSLFCQLIYFSFIRLSHFIQECFRLLFIIKSFMNHS